MRRVLSAVAVVALALSACTGIHLEDTDPALEGVRLACVFGDPLFDSPVYGDWEEVVRATNETGLFLDPDSYDRAMEALDQTLLEYHGLRVQALDKNLDLAANEILEYSDVASLLKDTIPRMWQSAEGDDTTRFWVLYSRFTGLCAAADKLRNAVTRAHG